MQQVDIDSGALRGTADAAGRLWVFKGIPFAAPPVGPLRWRPPEPPTAWTGVRDATAFGPAAPQTPRQPGEGSSAWTVEYQHAGAESEDCLTLNVWTPARPDGGPLPVIVWIHGGGFRLGSASVPVYDAAALAAEGAVVVSIQYRIGILGFLATPELSSESPDGVSGNYGLLDQIAALEWVQRNVAAFGGDPERVTIFGQSAGAGSVQLLTLAPGARGLFSRGIADNGILAPRDPLLQERSPSAYRTLGDAEAAGASYLDGAGVRSLERLRSLTVQELLALPPAPFPPAYWSPTVDGHVLPDRYEPSYARGAQADVPIMAGWTNAFDPNATTTLEEHLRWVAARFGPVASEFHALYPASDGPEAVAATECFTQDSYRTSLRLWAAARSTVPSPAYLFSWTHPTPGMERFGAFPTSEIPYVMGSLSTSYHPYTAEDRGLSDLLRRTWVRFAETGDPNGAGLPHWPAAGTEGPELMRLDVEPGAVEAPDAPRFDFIRRWFASHPAS